MEKALDHLLWEIRLRLGPCQKRKRNSGWKRYTKPRGKESALFSRSRDCCKQWTDCCCAYIGMDNFPTSLKAIQFLWTLWRRTVIFGNKLHSFGTEKKNRCKSSCTTKCGWILVDAYLETISCKPLQSLLVENGHFAGWAVLFWSFQLVLRKKIAGPVIQAHGRQGFVPIYFYTYSIRANILHL